MHRKKFFSEKPKEISATWFNCPAIKHLLNILLFKKSFLISKQFQSCQIHRSNHLAKKN